MFEILKILLLPTRQFRGGSGCCGWCMVL